MSKYEVLIIDLMTAPEVTYINRTLSSFTLVQTGTPCFQIQHTADRNLNLKLSREFLIPKTSVLS